MIRELKTVPEVKGFEINYKMMMGLDLIQLHQMIERKKLLHRMHSSATKIQGWYKAHFFKKYQEYQRRVYNGAALKIQEFFRGYMEMKKAK